MQAVGDVALVWLIAAARFLLLHGPDNQSYWLNPEQVTTLREPMPSDLQKAFAPGTHCIIVTVNGKFLSVTETCQQVYQLIMTAR